jgi:phage terminase large subunit-like protein
MRMRARRQAGAVEIDPALLAELHLLEAAVGGQSILDYIPRASPIMPGGPQGIAPKHLRVVADQVALSEYQPVRVAVSVPARMGKTELIVHSIAWYLARHPEHTVAYVSYSADIAGGKSVRARDIAIASDVRLRSDQARASEWRTTSGGGLLATGVGGPLTGQGCFVAGTLVSTPAGSVPIEVIKPGDQVLGYDGVALQNRNVLAVRELERHVLRVTTVSGRVVYCTDDHPFYVHERGYVAAGDLDAVTGPGPGVAGQLAGWPQDAGWEAETDPGGRGLRPVRSSRPEDVRGVEATKGQIDLLVVLPRVHSQEVAAEPGQDGVAEVRPVRQGDRGQEQALPTRQEAQGVLQQRMPYLGVEGDAELLQPLRRVVRGQQHAAAVLLDGLQERSTQSAHARPGEFSLQDRYQLRDVVQDDGGCHPGARSVGVPGVLRRATRGGLPAQQWRTHGEALIAGAPLQRHPVGQQARELDHAVPAVSHWAPQVGIDAVYSVERVGGAAHRVYDIQVEGTSNFFAEGILVHNCNLLIVDDPIKNREEAESATYREKVWEWFTSTAMSRLTPNGSVIVVHTRWHPDDLIGKLKKKGGWNVINLPALDQAGNALWPEGGWTADVLKKRRVDVGEYDWASIYMGEPRPRGGRLFEEPTFYDRPNVLGGARVIIACDPAATAKTHADYSVIVVGACWMGADGLPCVDILDVQRMQVEIPFLVQRLAQEQRRWRAPVVVEAVGGFKAVPQTLRAMLRGVRIIEVTPTLDKFTRALPTSAGWNAGRIRVPGKLGPAGVLEASADKPWLGTYLTEMGDFTGIADDHDDQVDATAHLYAAAYQLLAPRASGTAAEIARYMPFG